MTHFSPREIVSELDRFIVGQTDAKRAVAIALRNRWRRLQLEGGLREDRFSERFSLRVNRCWDFITLRTEQARGLAIRIDLRVHGASQALEAFLRNHAGPTPVMIEVLAGAGAGRLLLDGGKGLAMDDRLPERLRSLPGVSRIGLRLDRPWA